MIGTPQDVTEYQEVVMSCIYRRNIMELLTTNVFSYFCIELQVTSEILLESLNRENKQGEKKAYLSSTEVNS